MRPLSNAFVNIALLKELRFSNIVSVDRVVCECVSEQEWGEGGGAYVYVRVCMCCVCLSLSVSEFARVCVYARTCSVRACVCV